MEYEWDPARAAETFRTMSALPTQRCRFEDPRGVSVPDPDSSGESRLIYLGADPSGRILVTVYTLRGRTVRIISSRKASRAERRAYEAQS